jgi:hypothetical protein
MPNKGEKSILRAKNKPIKLNERVKGEKNIF